MNGNLWERVEDLEHDLRMLRALDRIVHRYATRVLRWAVSGKLLEIITTLDSIVAQAKTISSDTLEKFSDLAFDLEVPFALAREKKRDFTNKERKQVSEAIEELASNISKLIGQTENELYAIWEQIGKDTGL